MAHSEAITQCKGYASLLEVVVRDESKSSDWHDYRAKLDWVVERAEHYAEATGLNASDILDSWEASRTYGYMNYYQDANQPKIESDKVHVFDTVDQAKESIGNTGYRCPACAGVSNNPYRCDVGDDCNWASSGLFRTMGKGVYIYLKDKLAGEEIFMPVAWEKEDKVNCD